MLLKCIQVNGDYVFKVLFYSCTGNVPFSQITILCSSDGTDYVALSETVTLSESTDNISECFSIEIISDGALEQIETFMIAVTTDDTNVTIQASPMFIIISDTDGKCTVYLEHNTWFIWHTINDYLCS